VAPVMLAAQFLEVLVEERAHRDDAVRHALDLTEPLLMERIIRQDVGSDTSSVHGGVGVQRTDEDLDLGVDALLLLARLADDGEGTDTLAVQTHVLRKTLGEDRAEAFADEVAEREGVLVRVSAGEALVRHIKEGEVVTLLDSLGNLEPLLLRRVDTSGVVSARVEQDDAALGHVLDVGDHAIEIKADGVLVVVAVLLNLEPRVLEDGCVVCPRGGRDIDGLCTGVVTLKEGATNPKRARTGDGLRHNNPALAEGSRFAAIGKREGSIGELGDTGDASILLVHLCRDNIFLRLPYRGQHVGLALVIAVGTHTCTWSATAPWSAGWETMLTQIDLLGVAVGLEGFRDAQNGLW